MDFVLTVKINYFPTILFFSYGANLNIVMLVESFLILTIPRLLLINTFLIKKRVLFTKSNFLMFRKIRPKKVPAKINAEICEQ